MRYLPFGSVWMLLMACAPAVIPSGTPDAVCLQAAAPVFQQELYNASVDVYGNHISGLMFFKTMPDSSKRVVFTTETGLTFFTFQWDKHGAFTVQHVIKKLNRKVVINLLRKDLELMLLPPAYTTRAIRHNDNQYAVPLKKETIWFTTSGCRTLSQAEVKAGDVVKTRALFFPRQKNVPDSVYIQHLNFNMQLALKRLEQDHASE